MVNDEKVVFWLRDAKRTRSAASSLMSSLYTVPLDIFFIGELGSGKTTFIQGIGLGLGLAERSMTSPTFALEQYYTLPSPSGGGLGRGAPLPYPLPRGEGGGLLHVDLYRLSPREAEERASSTDDFPGIRCIEWAKRLRRLDRGRKRIVVELSDGAMAGARGGLKTKNYKLHTGHEGREVRITFEDLPLPSRKDVLRWRKEVRLPSPVCRHCDVVGAFAETLGRMLLERGIITRPLALRRAGELHDLLRFVDFRSGAAPGTKVSAADTRTWGKIRKHFSGLSHEAACAAFLRERGYEGLAWIIEPHGLKLPPKKRQTMEQKLLFYADKRVRFDRVVSLRERFRDFKERYGNGSPSLTAGRDSRAREWYEEARQLERELFPSGPPS